jgi:glycosyltransferase involved in cell wall biosynthesis
MVGLTIGGGISQPTLRLAEELVTRGYEVTVLVARTQFPITQGITEWYRQKGIELVECEENRSQTSPWWLAFQLSIARKIGSINPDLVIAQEWQAPLALYANINSQSKPVITWAHGGTLYEKIGSDSDFANEFELIVSHLEKLQIQKSDVMVAPSTFLTDLYRDFGMENIKSKVIPLHLPEIMLIKPSADVCIVFVGALSYRKGFDKFIDTCIDLSVTDLDFEVKIFGKIADIQIESQISKLNDHKIKFTIDHDLETKEIWSILAEKNTTLVVPSRLDNSPGVIYEAIASGTKVISSLNHGGLELGEFFPGFIEELKANPQEHLEFLRKSVTETDSRLGFNQKITELWIDLIRNTATANKNKGFPKESVDPSISVIIPTKNRVMFLEKALQSVSNQTLKPIEVIVVDDGSSQESEVVDLLKNFEGVLNIRSIHNKLSVGQAAARNLGAKEAKSDLIAFLDDDNVLYPNHLQQCYDELLRGELDAVTPFLSQKFSDRPFNEIGAPQMIAVFCGEYFGELNSHYNVICDSHILMKREKFLEIGGFPDGFPVAQEDWALGLKMLGKNLRFGTTTNPSVYYRLNLDGVQNSSSGFKPWWPIDQASTFLNAPTAFGSQLARILRSSQTFGTTPKSRFRIYFKVALQLIREMKFRQLIWGIKKFKKRYFF